MTDDKWKIDLSLEMSSSCAIFIYLATFKRCGGAGGLVVLAGFKPVAGLREAAWVGSIPTRLRQQKQVGRKQKAVGRRLEADRIQVHCHFSTLVFEKGIYGNDKNSLRADGCVDRRRRS